MKIMISEQFQQFMAQLGIDLNTTLEAAGVAKVIWQEQLELTSTEYWQLMNQLSVDLPDRAIVNFGDIQKINTFMPAFFAALAAKNGMEAIQRLADYKSLIGPCHLDVLTTADQVAITHVGDAVSQLPRFTVMTEQLLVLSLIRVGTGTNVIPRRVASAYQYGDIIRPIFGITPEEQPTNVLVFDRQDLKRPFISANNTMWAYLRPELDRQKLLVKNATSLEDTVQTLLLKKLPSGHYSIDDVAASLNLSKRTLQRNLSSRDTTFNQLVQRARQTLAESLIQDPTLSLIEISYLLGYADPESFSRAFKKWFQESPSHYRQQFVTI